MGTPNVLQKNESFLVLLWETSNVFQSKQKMGGTPSKKDSVKVSFNFISDGGR